MKRKANPNAGWPQSLHFKVGATLDITPTHAAMLRARYPTLALERIDITRYRVLSV